MKSWDRLPNELERLGFQRHQGATKTITHRKSMRPAVKSRSEPLASQSLETKSAGSMQLPKTPKGRKRYRELVDATKTALNKKGYSALNIQDIAAEADAPIGLFYRYFESKDDAVLAAVSTAVSEYRAQFEGTKGETYFEHQKGLHKLLVSFFGNWPGVMSCYYSLSKGGIFTAYFERSTLDFDELHARRAFNHTDGHLSQEALLPTIHALTALSDNFLFRYYTHRDDTEILSRAAGADIPSLLAGLRVRGLFLGKAGRPGDGLTLPVRKKRPASANPVFASKDDFTCRPTKTDHESKTSSRHHILLATQEVLNELSFEELRLKDIEDASGMTRGSLYHHFSDKRDLVREALNLWMDDAYSALRSPPATPSADEFGRLRSIAGHLIREYAQKPGMLRVIYDLEDRDLEVSRRVREDRYEIANRIIEAANLTPKSRRQADLNLIIGYAMLSLADRYAFDVYSAHLRPFADMWENPQDLADLISTLWYRMIFGAQPQNAPYDKFPTPSTERLIKT
jgi:AcrR family transcriptional regulator